MKNIHILPTDKPSRLYLGDNGNFVFGMSQTAIQSRNDDFTNQNIYITSDEKIKEGDWHLSFLRDKFEVINYLPNGGYRKECLGKEVCKIILTTDFRLSPDVQKIDDEFVEWFVNNPSCEVIQVEKSFHWDNGVYEYEIIIPKEEPKKVLTEEDIFNQKDIDAVTDYINKEQQKQALIVLVLKALLIFLDKKSNWKKYSMMIKKKILKSLLMK